jgi:hypothetical protein
MGNLPTHDLCTKISEKEAILDTQFHEFCRAASTLSNENGTNSNHSSQEFQDLNQKLLSIVKKIDFILKRFEQMSKKEEHIQCLNINSIKNGGLLKVAFIGRYGNNQKLINCFFLNQKSYSSERATIYSANELSHYKIEQNFKQKNSDHSITSMTCNIDYSNAIPFFCNLENLDFISSFFPLFYKATAFSKDLEFKTDLFAENYENCVELDLKELSKFIFQLCENDIVVYASDKNSENIKTEANFFDYMVKKSPLLKNKIKQKKFFIVLKTHKPYNTLYHYQNEEANDIFNRLNEMFGFKFIFEIDIEKSYEEKIIYFSKLLENYNNQNTKQYFNLSVQNNNQLYRSTSKLITKYYSDYLKQNPLNMKVDHIGMKLNEVITKKFKIVNSKNFDANYDVAKNGKFKKFYQNYVQKHDGINYFSYDLNKIKEFDKEIYDSIVSEVDKKLKIIKNKIELKTFLNDYSYSKYFNNGECEVKNDNKNPTFKINKVVINKNSTMISKKVNESFNYLKSEIEKEVLYFLKKFSEFTDKIDNIKALTREKRSFKGSKLLKYKLNFILEIFDIYGLKHYYTSISIEAINIYYNYMKKLFLSYLKILNNTNITLASLHNNIRACYDDIKCEVLKENTNFLNYSEDKISKFNLNFEKIDTKSLNFFNLLLFKTFYIKTIKYKPIFAFYNITNFAGLILSFTFIVKAFRKYFKFQPNKRKILSYIFYALISSILSYVLSFILNKIYNTKSEKKFFKLISQIKINVSYIRSQLQSYDKSVEEFKKRYLDNSLNLINKLS